VQNSNSSDAVVVFKDVHSTEPGILHVGSMSGWGLTGSNLLLTSAPAASDIPGSYFWPGITLAAAAAAAAAPGSTQLSSAALAAAVAVPVVVVLAAGLSCCWLLRVRRKHKWWQQQQQHMKQVHHTQSRHLGLDTLTGGKNSQSSAKLVAAVAVGGAAACGNGAAAGPGGRRWLQLLLADAGGKLTGGCPAAAAAERPDQGYPAMELAADVEAASIAGTDAANGAGAGRNGSDVVQQGQCHQPPAAGMLFAEPGCMFQLPEVTNAACRNEPGTHQGLAPGDSQGLLQACMQQSSHPSSAVNLHGCSVSSSAGHNWTAGSAGVKVDTSPSRSPQLLLQPPPLAQEQTGNRSCTVYLSMEAAALTAAAERLKLCMQQSGSGGTKAAHSGLQISLQPAQEHQQQHRSSGAEQQRLQQNMLLAKAHVDPATPAASPGAPTDINPAVVAVAAAADPGASRPQEGETMKDDAGSPVESAAATALQEPWQRLSRAIGLLQQGITQRRLEAGVVKQQQQQQQQLDSPDGNSGSAAAAAAICSTAFEGPCGNADQGMGSNGSSEVVTHSKSNSSTASVLQLQLLDMIGRGSFARYAQTLTAFVGGGCRTGCC
jgi:hypothetical protein